MRVFHIAKYFPPDHGGMEYFLRDLSRAQAEFGHEVTILAHAGNAAGPGLSSLAPNLTVRRFGVWGKLGGYAPVSPGLLLAAARAARQNPAAIFHVHAPNPAALALVPPIFVNPLVLHWHSDVVFPSNRSPSALLMAPWRLLEKSLLKRADRVICTSGRYADYSPYLGGVHEKIRVVPSALPVIRPLSEPGPAARWLLSQKAGRRIVAVGRLSHYKGFSYLLRAMALLPGASLLLIGDGEEKERLAGLRDDLGLGGRVFLAGPVADGDREAALDAADIFCLPSVDRSEAFGLALVEAMRAGLACLATSITGSGTSFVVDEGLTGLLAPPADSEALAAALKHLLANEDLRRAMGAAGRKRFMEHFTIQAISSLMNEVYEEVAAGKRGVRP